MFKNNYIKKLAFDNIKKQKKLYKFVFMALTLAFFLTTISSILFISFEDIGFIERSQRYGRWSLAIENITHEQMETMNKNPYVQEKGIVYDLGQLSFKNRSTGSLISIDAQTQKLLSLQLKEGRMPLSKNEIAIEEDELTSLGIPHYLNQTLTFIKDGREIQYKLVGIVQNYTHSYLLPIGSLITYGETSSQKIGLYNSEDNATLFNRAIEKGFYEGACFNVFTYTLISYDEGNQCFVDRDVTIEVQLYISFIGFSGVLGTMVSSMKKRENYFILVRAIGATKKQIQKLILYEGVLLEIISMVTGIIIGGIVSLVILWGYHYYINSPFIFIINKIYWMQIIIMSCTCFVAIILPSIYVYTIPLVGKLTQKVYGKKVRQKRKANVFSLSLREISHHKMMTCLIIIILIAEMVVSYFGMCSINNFIDSMERLNMNKDFDYVLKQEYMDHPEMNLTDQQIKSLTTLSGISSQVIHSHCVNISYDGIENSPLAIEYVPANLSHQYTQLTNAVIAYYENEEDLLDIFHKYHLKGNTNLKDYEAIIFKPHFYPHEENGTAVTLDSDNDIEREEYKERGLDIGSEIDVIYSEDESSEEAKVMSQPLKIVGTLMIEKMDKEDESLFQTWGSYLLIVNKEMYQKYFTYDFNQYLLFNVENNENIGQFKQNILSLAKDYSFDYQDTHASRQIEKTLNYEQVFKDVIFMTLVFVGIITLIYMQRKIYILSIRHEISLNRAIGMTKKQILIVYGLNGLYMYCLGFIGFIGGFLLNSLLGGMKEGWYKEFISIAFEYKNIIMYLILGVVFIITMLLPVINVLKENMLMYLKQD